MNTQLVAISDNSFTFAIATPLKSKSFCCCHIQSLYVLSLNESFGMKIPC